MILKNFQQFKEIKNIVKKYVKEDNDYFFRATLLIFFVSNGIRSALSFEPIDDLTNNEKGVKELNKYFKENKINVRVKYQWYIYNTDIEDKYFKMKKNEDSSQWFGRIYGYPEILSDNDFKKSKILYAVDYFVRNIFIFGYSQKTSIDMDPDRIKKILKVLKRLGINSFTLKIHIVHKKRKGKPMEGYSIDHGNIKLSYKDYFTKPS